MEQKTRGGAQQEVYLVQRMTFSPLAVREIFFAQTGRSGGGPSRGGAEEVQTDAEMEEQEVIECLLEEAEKELDVEIIGG